MTHAKARRVMLVVAAVVLVLLVLANLPTRERLQFKRTSVALQSHYQDFVTAAEAYLRDWKTNASSAPSTVAIGELASHGYLPPQIVSEFSGSEVVVSLSTVTPERTVVQADLVRVRRPGARDVVMASDGSVFIPAR